ncbi:MAG: RNA polymerase sigma factor RpoD/SigA, partial [Planctomycetota bacterium]
MGSTAGSDADLVKVYLHQMSRIPPISAEEERELAGELERSRGALRRAILHTATAIEQALEILERVHTGKLPIDRALLLDVREGAVRAELLRTIPTTVRAVGRLLAGARERFARYLASEDARTRLTLRAEVRDRIERAVELLDPYNIQISLLEQLFEAARQRLREIKSAERRARAASRRGADAAQLARAREALRSAEIEAVATPKILRLYIDAVREARRAYETAKKRLSAKNLRLVVSIAKSYRNKGLPFLDLIQEGNTGLMKALDRYQASRGNKFSTYATWWIKQTITRSIAYQSRTVRIPVHAIQHLTQLVEQREAFVKRHGREPSLEELAERTGLSAAEVGRLLELSRSALSLDQPYGGEDECHFGDLLRDERASDAIELSQKSQLRERVDTILSQLS